ncbi:hypothetical protein NW754_015674 [Fusarium falciforme]|nr:hypothetical protein NW754_015674 [Fusarium falciforme]
MSPQTIQEVLTDPVPAFVLDVNASINPRPVKTWMMVDPNDVMYWQGFNFANLRNAYGHIFDLLCPTCPVSDAHPRFVIQTLDELKQHGIETLHHLLQRPFQYAIPKLRQSLLCSKHDVLCDYKAPHTQIDWIWGVFYALDDTNLVVSCSRLSNTFTSEDLRLKKPDAIYTLRQLATYAATGKTRYGLILTDKEVVIVRFHVKSRNIEQYSVGEKLWDGKVIFYHHLSGRCVDKLPEGVRFYWEPKKKKRSAMSHAITLARRLTEPLGNINE